MSILAAEKNRSISTWKLFFGNKKKFAIQETTNCPDCSEECEEPRTEDYMTYAKSS